MPQAQLCFMQAKVHFTPILDLSANAPQMAARLQQAGYPDFIKGGVKANSVPTNPTDTPARPASMATLERLVFLNCAHSKGFIVEPNALILQTTEDATWESFIAEFMHGLNRVQACLNRALTERVGLRYLATVVPSTNTAGLTAVLAQGVLGLTQQLPAELALARTFTETHFRTGGCQVMVRTHLPTNPEGLAPELESLGIEQLENEPMGVKLAERLQQLQGEHALIDMDAAMEVKQALQLAAIQSQLTKLGSAIELAFNTVVKPTTPAVKRRLAGHGIRYTPVKSHWPDGQLAVQEAVGHSGAEGSATRRDLAHVRAVFNIPMTELAHIFGVTRQAVHEWARGGALAPANAEKLSVLAQVADVFAAAAMPMSAQLLRRKIAPAPSLLDALKQGEDVVDLARKLLVTLQRESQQRERLAASLVGRKRMQQVDLEYAVPHLAEDT